MHHVMDYDKSTFEDVVEQFGEVFFVLDSGEEYIVHGKAGYSINDERQTVSIQGVRDGEYLVVEFPLDSIEHHYTHKEV